MSDPRLRRPLWRGRTNVDALTIAAILRAESMLGFELSITQGSYQSSVAASAGTHDRGGAIDFSTKNMTTAQKARVVLCLRRAGFAAWLRRPSQGPWAEHIHGVVVGHPYLSGSAARQVTAYRNGRNGLANNAPDDGPRVEIKPPVWPYPAPKKRFGTWNGYVGQSPKNFAKGVDTILDKFPHLRSLALQEASRALPAIRPVAKAHGFQIVRSSALGVEGRSTLLLVNDDDFDVKHRGAIVVPTQWKGPKRGKVHPGRVFPTAVVDGVRSTAIHMAPGPVVNKAAFDAELRALRNSGNRWRPDAVWMGDWNMWWKQTGNRSVRALANALDARIVHDEARIDYALVRGFKNASYQTYSKLGSDAHRFGILTVSD